jgi:hypothetical protein
MGTMMLLIGSALFYSLIIFWIAEEKSLKNADFSDIKLCVTEKLDIGAVFQEFNTLFYLAIYFVAVLLFAAIAANYFFVPKGLGLAEVMMITFIPSLIGSLIILLVKWRYQPIIKLISSFLFGSIYMTATALAFAVVYLVHG